LQRFEELHKHDADINDIGIFKFSNFIGDRETTSVIANDPPNNAKQLYRICLNKIIDNDLMIDISDFSEAYAEEFLKQNMLYLQLKSNFQKYSAKIWKLPSLSDLNTYYFPSNSRSTLSVSSLTLNLTSSTPNPSDSYAIFIYSCGKFFGRFDIHSIEKPTAECTPSQAYKSHPKHREIPIPSTPTDPVITFNIYLNCEECSPQNRSSINLSINSDLDIEGSFLNDSYQLNLPESK